MPFVPVDEAYNKVVSQQEDAVIKQLPMHSLQIDDISGQKDARSSTCGRSEVKSHLSVFTNCTNPTFASVHNIWKYFFIIDIYVIVTALKRGSLLQQEVLAVLAAVAELIKDRGGKESDAEYFAALLTAIETIPATDESRLEAAFYLLRLVIKKLDEGVVRLCFSKAFQIFMKKLSETSPGPTLAKLICTLGDILRQQPAGIWENNNTRLSLMKIEMFALHEKSVVRSAARRTLCSILNDPMKATSDGYHPSALMVGEFITQHMAQGFGNKKIDMILRLLCLSEDIMHKMPYSIFKKFAEQALTALSISDAVLRCAIFRCFRKVLRQQPDVATLPLSTNILLCSLLRDFKSVASDPDVACFWLQAVCEALVCLTARDFLKSAVPLVSSLQQIFDTFDLGIESVATVACTVICRLVDHCVQQSEELPSYCVDLCNKSLNSQSSAVWRHVLRAEFRIIVVCKDSINEASLIRALIVLDELRKDSNRFIIPEIDLNIGAVVRYIGAEQVLSVLSLDLDSHSLTTIQLRKPWLIPILRVNMCNQSISLALRYFLPLANHLLKKKNSRNEMEKKTALILCVS
ncbi:unnamed protein product [Thelazia callipaeda]|uniref:NUC173 domain-containing protein n=1 Tax=Thelazia callipaeda TaxID=103827 RepID=A0A0N5CWK3_THECL|nr:unnamed protein product [Thelazia callipaeda]